MFDAQHQHLPKLEAENPTSNDYVRGADDASSIEAYNDIHKPYIGDDQELPETSLRTVVLGTLLSIILGATNLYAGLLAGVTTSASIPAAILSMGILRLFKDSSILENNQVQTAASAGESLAAGALFTLPAMYLFKTDPDQISTGWDNYLTLENYFISLALCLFGGILGVLFSVPIRRALIVEKDIDPPLTFPEGIATANVLIQGHKKDGGTKGLKALGAGAGIGSAFSILNEGLAVIKTSVDFGGWVTNEAAVLMQLGMSPILVAIGYIVGWRVGLIFLLGSLCQFGIAIPLSMVFDTPILSPENTTYFQDGFSPELQGTYMDASFTYWQVYTRNMGVGAMLFGSLFVLFDIRKSLYRGVAVGFRAFGQAAAGEAQGQVPRTQRDMPMKTVLLSILACTVVLYVTIAVFIQDWLSALALAILVVVLGSTFSAVAGFNAGLVGSSNNPVSGVTISTVLIVALVVRLLLGANSPLGAPISVLVGTVVCCAAAISGDNLQDLKAGYLLGATPAKQVQMQLLGVTVSSFIMAPVLQVLAQSYGFGGIEPGSLPTPQASVMKTVSEGVIFGTLPVLYLVIGAGCAAVVILLDLVLKRYKSTFRMPVMAFAIGFYLPMYLGAGVFVGSLVGVVCRKESQQGLLVSSGLVTGYGLTGLLIAAVVVVNSFVTGSGESPLVVNVNIPAWGATLLSFVQLAVLLLTIWVYARVPDDEDEEEEFQGDEKVRRVSVEY